MANVLSQKANEAKGGIHNILFRTFPNITCISVSSQLAGVDGFSIG